MSEQAQIWLPWPPSVHKLYGKRPGGGKFRTKEYKRWQHEAGWMLKLQKAGAMPGAVNVDLRLTPPDKRKRDADNILKATLDLLVQLGVIDDDNSRVVRKLSTEWAEDERAGVHVTLTAVETAEV